MVHIHFIFFYVDGPSGLLLFFLLGNAFFFFHLLV